MDSISRYIRRLNRALDCPKALRRPFLNRTRKMAEDCLLNGSDDAAQDVAYYLGDPQELAQGFLKTLDQEVLKRYRRQKKFLLWGCIAVLAIMLVGVAIWGMRPMTLEVTETVTIYPIVTEETT